MADAASALRSVRTLALLGVAAYAAFLVATLPARLAVDWFAPDTVTVAGLQGTVWSGSASAIAAGDVRLGRTTWSSRPLSLFLARARFHVETQYAGGTVLGNVAFGVGGSVFLDDVTGVLPLAGAERVVPNIPPVTGRLGVSLASARLADGWPLQADGTIDLINVAVLAPTRFDLGTFQVEFDPDSSEPLVGRVSDVQSSLGLRGELRLGADRAYDIDVTISPDPSLPEVIEALNFLTGPAGPDGHRFTYAGAL